MCTNIKILFSSLLVGAILAGCSNDTPATQEAQEKQLEEYVGSQGVDVDVDLNGGTPNVTLNQSAGGTSTQVGTNLTLPNDFPDDIAIFPGMQIIAASVMPQGHMVHAQTSATLDEIADFYTAQMTADGWVDTTSDVQPPAMRSLIFEKGERRAGVTLIPGTPNTTIQVTTVTLG